VQQKVTRYLEATGYASAINTTNLVARVQGFLQKINYKDGDQVKDGATLFVIEPEPYKHGARGDGHRHAPTFLCK
jgi:multidrug efflux pump subunit AcrA (membrane-fusion protein)